MVLLVSEAGHSFPRDGVKKAARAPAAGEYEAPVHVLGHIHAGPAFSMAGRSQHVNAEAAAAMAPGPGDYDVFAGWKGAAFTMAGRQVGAGKPAWLTYCRVSVSCLAHAMSCYDVAAASVPCTNPAMALATSVVH